MQTYLKIITISLIILAVLGIVYSMHLISQQLVDRCFDFYQNTPELAGEHCTGDGVVVVLQEVLTLLSVIVGAVISGTIAKK